MRPYLLTFFLSLSFFGCIGWQPAWGDTDKTIVDLERGPSALPARYSRPRGAQLYRYDKTEIDFAAPLTAQPDGSQAPVPPQSSTTGAATPTGRRTLSTVPPDSGR